MKKYILLMVVIMIFCAGISFAENQKTKSIQGVDKQIQTLQGASSSSLQQQVSALREYTKRLNEKINKINEVYNKQIVQLQKNAANLQKKIRDLENAAPTADTGILGFTKTLVGDYIFSANGAKIEISRTGGIVIKSAANMEIKSGLTMNIKSAGVMHISSALLNLNGGGFPVARVGSQTIGDPTTHTILDGSPTVFVP